MINQFILALSISMYAADPSADCGTINFPETFYLRGQWEAIWREEVYITPEADTDDDAGEEFGIFESMCMSFNGDIKLTDATGTLVGSTDKQTAFEWGTEINIYDCNGNKVWIVDEDGSQVIVNNLNPFGSLFGIYEVDENGEKGTQLAFSDKDEYLDSEFTIRNMQGKIVAHAYKSVWDQLLNSVDDTTWEIQTSKDTTNAQALVVSYIIALQEVQDQLDNTDYNYDMCTQFAIGGICVAVIVVILIIAFLVWLFCCNDECCNLSGLI